MCGKCIDGRFDHEFKHLSSHDRSMSVPQEQDRTALDRAGQVVEVPKHCQTLRVRHEPQHVLNSKQQWTRQVDQQNVRVSSVAALASFIPGITRNRPQAAVLEDLGSKVPLPRVDELVVPLDSSALVMAPNVLALLIRIEIDEGTDLPVLEGGKGNRRRGNVSGGPIQNETLLLGGLISVRTRCRTDNH
jgi:hypothetical protein